MKRSWEAFTDVLLYVVAGLNVVEAVFADSTDRALLHLILAFAALGLIELREVGRAVRPKNNIHIAVRDSSGEIARALREEQRRSRP